MPLLDHFHPPLEGRRHWESFHAQWASAMADSLNQILPGGFFAEVQVHHGPRIEVDVATWGEYDRSGGGVATMTSALPKLETADLTLAATFPPAYGVQVFDTAVGPVLAAAIELVSPGNKDRPKARRAFTSKCAMLISQAVGLIVVDVVTSMRSRPFEELVSFAYPDLPLPDLGPLTAVSYRPTRIDDADTLEIRHRSLAVGEPLPELPLALGGLGHVMLDLEACYEDARSRSRL